MASVDFGNNGIYFNKELVQKKPMQETIELSLFDRIESIMGHFEKALDDAGTILVISTLSGTVRIGFGLTQLIIAVAIKAFAETALTVAKGMKGDVEFWQKIDARSWNHIQHGIINVGRGLVECMPIVNRAMCKNVEERDKFIYYNEIKNETIVTNNNSDPYPPLTSIKKDRETIWFNRFFYEGELKRMHLNIQEVANKHIIQNDDTNIVLESVV